MSGANEKLEAARLKRRWSVEVASAKVGVSVNTFNRWERGLQVPQLDTLDRLCKAFDMTPEELGFGHAIMSKRRSPPQLRGYPPSHTTLATTSPSPASRVLATASEHINSSPLSSTSISQSLPRDLAANPLQTGRDITHQKQVEGSESQELEVSRRQAMTLLVSTPVLIFNMAQSTQKTLLHPEEAILLGRSNLPLCWQLYFEGGQAEVEQLLPGYLSQLSALMQSSSAYQKRIAELLAQAHQLSYLVAIQRQDFGTALQHTQDATQYGQLAENTDLLVSSLSRRAYVYYCLKRLAQRLQTYQEALLHASGSSPLIRGYLYAGLAETHAARQEAQEATKYLELAYQTFPDRPEEDANFSYTHFRRHTLYTLEGLMHLHLNRPQQAWEAFTRVDQSVPAELVPHRVEATVHQAATACALDELEQSCTLLERAVTAALALGSRLRYDEAYAVYEQMIAKWGSDTRVQDLVDLFH